jgi:hypothetical protein
MNANAIPISLKLEALQAVADNPDINWVDTPYFNSTDDIIAIDTPHRKYDIISQGMPRPCHMTGEGRALWERFTRHVNAGYKKLTMGERLFWLTAYTGDRQPDDQALLSIARTSTFPKIRDAAITYYATHQGKQGVTGEWRPVLTNILASSDNPEYMDAAIALAPIVDERLIRHAVNGDVIATWLATHPRASDTLIDQWLYSGDGRLVAAVILGIAPANLPRFDVDKIVDGTRLHREYMGAAFACVAQYFTIPQMETLLDNGVTTVSDMLAFGGPYADEQWEFFDKYDHEEVKAALWDYRRYALYHQQERECLFTNPTGRFATKVEESCLKPEEQEQKADGWTTM